MSVEGLKFAQTGSMESGLKPMILMPGSPKWRSSETSSGVKVICSPPNL